MITLYDTETEKFYTWSLSDAKIDFKEEPLRDMDKSNFVFYSFNNNEIKMMEHFIHFWETNYPGTVVGYNSQAYDLPYIIRRIENILTKGDAARLSPIGKYFIREVNHDNERANVQAEIEVDISGIFSADEMVLYRDKFKVKPALDGGYSLNNVGEVEGLGKKIHYSGTLKDLYEKDYQKFYEYNVRDVDLLKRIEEKCKLIPLARRVAGSGLTNYNAIYSSISYLVGSLIAFGKTEMEGSPICQSYLNEKKESEGYEGAYVFPPVVGLYKGGIACVDFNSLYPSTIRALNLSPETYVGKIIPIGSPNPDDPLDLDNTEITTFYLKPPTGQTRQLSKDELLELCKTKCIFTRNNTLFLKHSVKQGLVSAWSKHFYGLRKSTKKEMQALEMKLYNKEITDPVEIKRAKIQVENLNNMQMAVKIMLNSIYGILGCGHSPIANNEIAQTITRTGKFANMSAATYIKEWFKEKFKVSDDYVTPVSGDTDSVIGSTKIFVKQL
jgi:DNA polymerase elongation subunit (family B)